MTTIADAPRLAAEAARLTGEAKNRMLLRLLYSLVDPSLPEHVLPMRIIEVRRAVFAEIFREDIP